VLLSGWYFMYLVFSQDLHLGVRIMRHLPTRLPAHVTDAWAEFDRGAQSATALVVAMPGLPHPIAIREVERIATRHPLVPIIFVIDRDAEFARQLCHIGVTAIVWTHACATELPDAIARAQAGTVFERVASCFEDSDRLAPPLRDAMILACRSRVPPRSVLDLARLSGCHRSTLWEHWHREFGHDCPLRLEDLLAWLNVLYAVSHHEGGRKWDAVASELRVHPRTIQRHALRLARLHLRDLDHGMTALLLDRFSDGCLVPLRLGALPRGSRTQVATIGTGIRQSVPSAGTPVAGSLPTHSKGEAYGRKANEGNWRPVRRTHGTGGPREP
jgi:DNA-binding NarL/FixJ family response regulator